MDEIKIDLITNENIETYKSLRLASLKDSPDAFGSSYERENAFTNDQWKARIKPNGNMDYLLPLLIEYDGDYVGLAFGGVFKREPYRGKGLGKSLLAHIRDWAVELDLNKLLLSVTTTNLGAINLYQSFGFEAVSETEPLRENSDLVIQPMELRLDTNC